MGRIVINQTRLILLILALLAVTGSIIYNYNPETTPSDSIVIANDTLDLIQDTIIIDTVKIDTIEIDTVKIITDTIKVDTNTLTL